MALSKALTTSASQHWTTPAGILERVRQIGPIALDPCGNEHDEVRAITSWWGLTVGPPRQPHHCDGLAESWEVTAGHLVYVNPPFGAGIGAWVKKCHDEARAGVEIVLLVPARTDTRWWHRWVRHALARVFLAGRLKFGQGGKPGAAPAPFPTALAYWGPRPGRFAAAFEDAGEVVVR